MPHVTEKNLAHKARAWAKLMAKYNTHRLKLDVKHSALLVVDMQNFFLDPKSPTFAEGGLAILPRVKKLIQAFRSAKRPVIYTAHVHAPDGSDAGIMKWWWQGMCKEGTPEAEIHPRIAPRPSEKVVKKHRYSGFYHTDLETILRGLKLKDLVISGTMTNLCCESTARDAYYRDYRVFFLLDGTGTVSEEYHLATLKNLAYGFAYVTTTQEILNSLKRSG
jgi:ureidoacrylate peracid hydrolase